MNTIPEVGLITSVDGHRSLLIWNFGRGSRKHDLRSTRCRLRPIVFFFLSGTTSRRYERWHLQAPIITLLHLLARLRPRKSYTLSTRTPRKNPRKSLKNFHDPRFSILDSRFSKLIDKNFGNELLLTFFLYIFFRFLRYLNRAHRYQQCKNSEFIAWNLANLSIPYFIIQ